MKSISNAKSTALFAVITLLMISAVPTAFAMSTPGAGTTPDPIPPGGVTNISFEESSEAPHSSLEGIYVFHPNTFGNVVDNTISTCPMPVVQTSGDYWVLLTVGGTALTDAINYWIPDTGTDNAQISVPFGGGVAVVITPSNGAKVGTGTAPADGTGFGQTTPLAGEWHKLSNVGTQGTEVPNGANSDDTTTLGQYTAISCGNEETTQAAPTVFIGQYQANVNFQVVEPVGGEITSLNTSALLIAGLTSSGLWIIPAFGAAVGTGITLFKIRRHN